MLINNVALTSLDICAKILTQYISPAQIIFFYKLFLFMATLPWILFKGLHSLKTSELKIHFLRSLLSVLGGISFYKGLTYIKVADAAALENLQYIILAMVGMIFFKEEWSKTKIISIILGFIGAIIIVNPNFFISLNKYNFKINKSYIYTVIAIIFWSLNSITVKILGRTEKNRTQLFYLLLFALMWSLPGAILKFKTTTIFGIEFSIIPQGFINIFDIHLPLKYLKYIFIMGTFYFIHSIAYFNALKRDISLVVPFRYTKLIFSGIAGYIFFQEIPSKLQILGYILIILSGIMLVRREVNIIKRSKNN